jgi:hypothetical protein
MNPIQKIGNIAETVGKDILHGAEDVIGVGETVFKVLSEIKALTPTFKVELAKLIQDAEPIATALAPAIATEGANITVDIEAVTAIYPALKTLVADFVAFLPQLKAAAEELSAEVARTHWS